MDDSPENNEVRPLGVKPAEPQIKIGSALDDLANFSHQKGDVRMISINSDKLDNILSASGSLASNFFFLFIGGAFSVFLALKSGSVEAGWIPIFKLALVLLFVFSAFPGILTLKQEWKKYCFRQELKPSKERWPQWLWPS